MILGYDLSINTHLSMQWPNRVARDLPSCEAASLPRCQPPLAIRILSAMIFYHCILFSNSYLTLVAGAPSTASAGKSWPGPNIRDLEISLKLKVSIIFNLPSMLHKSWCFFYSETESEISDIMILISDFKLR